jgi:hypothetical protein
VEKGELSHQKKRIEPAHARSSEEPVKTRQKGKRLRVIESFKRAGQKGQRSYGLPLKDCSKVPKDYGIKQSGSTTSSDTIYSVSFWLIHGSPLPDSFLFVLFLLKVFYGLSDSSRNRQTQSSTLHCNSRKR